MIHMCIMCSFESTISKGFLLTFSLWKLWESFVVFGFFLSLLFTNKFHFFNDSAPTRMQDLHGQGISMIGDAMNLKSKDSSFSSQKPHGLLGGSTQPEFGIVSPHSLLNPSQKSSRMNSRETDSFASFNEQDAQGQHPLRHFIDNWPKDHSDRGSVTWPEELKSDWTQLSMSIPMSSSEFSSSSNSPPQEKTTLSPLRLAREIDHIQMGLSVNNNDLSEQNQKQHSNWMPVAWGSSNSSSLGGPLGEVLNSTTYSSVVGGSKNSSSALNLMTEVWGGDGNSPQMGCSPTGVLQKSTFVSLSNSSSGSSPRGDNNNNNNKKAPKSASLCDDILASSASIPST